MQASLDAPDAKHSAGPIRNGGVPNLVAQRALDTSAEMLREHGVGEADIEVLMARAKLACDRQRAEVAAWMRRGGATAH